LSVRPLSLVALLTVRHLPAPTPLSRKQRFLQLRPDVVIP